MKKIFTEAVIILLFVCTLLCGCAVSGSGGSQTSTGNNDGEQVEPVTPKRDIYLTRFETYNLSKQLEYEGKDLATYKISLGESEESFRNFNYDGDNFAIASGVITPKDCEPTDITTDVISIKSDDEEEIVNVHVVNKEKYGNTFMTVDVGRLYGKTVTFFGDSITDQNAVWWTTNTWWKIDKTGKYIKEQGKVVTVNGISKNYVNMLDDVCQFEAYYNPAVAGALCSHYNAAYANKSISIPAQISQNLSKIKLSDYVFVMGGTNDSYEINKRDSVLMLGEKDDLAGSDAFANDVTGTPRSTFYGFYNYILKTIRETNPSAGLICLSNIPCQSTYGYAGGISNGHNNEGIKQVNAAIKVCAESYAACYVDIYSAIPYNEKLQQYTRVWFTNDELHPNQVAYELITDKILSGK